MKQPNILLIYPDQMRADYMSAYGKNKSLKTPHIDRLAYEGVLCENAFSSFPFCCPFRASILTGKYAHSNGMKANHYDLELGQTFLTEVLKDVGYYTGFFGKWHLGGHTEHGVVANEFQIGFDEFVTPRYGHRYFNAEFYRENDDTPRVTGRYAAEDQTDHLIDFMDRALDTEKPFFGYISYGIPHFPNVAAEHYLKLYREDEVEMPADVPVVLQPAVRTFLAQNYGLMACVDFQIGRILSWLDYAGVADDTVVIFVSDHGETAGQHSQCPLYKKSYYRSAAQVPLIVRWPNKVMTRYRHNMMVNPCVDIFPTICEIAGATIPSEVQGESFLSNLLDANAPNKRDFAYYQITKEAQGPEAFPNPERGIRDSEWLYVEREGQPVALFNEVIDPDEVNNVVNEPETQKIIEHYHLLLQQEMERLQDDWAEEMVWPPKDFNNPIKLKAYNEYVNSSKITEIPRNVKKTASKSI